MMAFEDEYAHAEYVTVYERIGKPAFKAIDEMTGAELKAAIKKLIGLLKKMTSTWKYATALMKMK
jgi:hypothetical protein